MKKHFKELGINKGKASKIPLTLTLATLKPKDKNKIRIIFETQAHQSTRVPLKPFYKKISRFI
ncbi:hypothetical protein [Aureispira sp. CCB-QB1]|uniref:hypothetical protein n=1 Tax=Aureispira sp. CCB-QB1 TaxID=1313421 RepID=UPI000696F29C|nr:hypothetical protein [Aureispira sp. CCB-QB1]